VQHRRNLTFVISSIDEFLLCVCLALNILCFCVRLDHLIYLHELEVFSFFNTKPRDCLLYVA